MKKLLILIGIITIFCCCAKNDIGFLNINYAGYSIDSLEVRIELDNSEGVVNPLIMQEWEAWGKDWVLTI